MSDHVLGCDLGLANCGAATITQTGRVDTWVRHHDLPNDATLDDDIDRIWGQATWIIGHATTGTRLAIVEGPSLHSKYGQPHERAALFWLVVRALRRRGIPVAVIAPKRMKWFITGNGNADKAEVRAAVARLWPGQGLARVSWDEADATGLAGMGACWMRWDGPWFDSRALAIEQGAAWPERDAVRA